MHRLFWKIFAGFWATMIVLLLAMAGLEWFVPLEPPGLSHQPLLDQALASEADHAARLLQKGGMTALNQELEAFENRTGSQAYWLNGSGEEPTGTDITAPIASTIVRELAIQAAQGQQSVSWRAAGLSFYAAITVPKAKAVMVVALPRGLPRTHVKSRLLRLLVTILAAGLVSWVVAQHVVQPIEALRAASRRLATGDLEARVAASVQRRDEIGLLARDFDQMATQLQTLVDAQQRLLRDVSHELRTPLTRLSLTLALLDRDTPAVAAGTITPHRERMEAEIASLNALIGELLALSRLENQLTQQSIAPQTSFDALVCLRQVAAEIEWEANQSPAPVKVRIESAVESTMMDGEEALLRRALQNLARNALRYSPAQGEIVFSLHHIANHWELILTDEGPGVPEAELEAIFRPFYRAQNTEIGKTQEGHGLGLSIARRAIELQGGTLRARNRVPHGLEFVIEMPEK